MNKKEREEKRLAAKAAMDQASAYQRKKTVVKMPKVRHQVTHHRKKFMIVAVVISHHKDFLFSYLHDKE